MKNKRLVKFPKKYKLGWRLVGEPMDWSWFWRIKYPLWLLRPICWIKGHNKKIVWPFGMKIKYCTRCSQTYYKKKTTEKVKFSMSGEIGQLYGVIFSTTKRSKSVKGNK